MSDTETESGSATTTARLVVTENGPYVLEGGGVPLRRRRPLTTDAGEPVDWETHQEIESAVEDRVALCRCGHSANKPYCDGSHADSDFDGTEAAPTERYDKRARAYEGTGIVMRDDRGICEHAGFCANKSTHVWAMVKQDAVADPEARAEAAGMVERCPSGALTYRLPGHDEDVEPALSAAIHVVDDGPLALTGGIEVQRSDGEPIETRARMTLCRCGASGIKPLCDGSHTKIGFSDS